MYFKIKKFIIKLIFIKSKKFLKILYVYPMKLISYFFQYILCDTYCNLNIFLQYDSYLNKNCQYTYYNF